MKLEDMLLLGALAFGVYYYMQHQQNTPVTGAPGPGGTPLPPGVTPVVPPAQPPTGGGTPPTNGGSNAVFPNGPIGGWTCAQYTDPYSGCNLYHVSAIPGDCVARDNTGRCLAYLDANGNAVYAL